jgi:hypothetical protein
MFLGMMSDLSISDVDVKKKSQILSQISMFAHRIQTLIRLIEKVQGKAESNIETHLHESGYDSNVRSDLTILLKKLQPLEALAYKTVQMCDALQQSINIVDFKHLYFMDNEYVMDRNIKKCGIKPHSVILVEDAASTNDLDVKAYYFFDKEKKIACGDNGERICVPLKLTRVQMDFIDNHRDSGSKSRRITQVKDYDPEKPLADKILVNRKKPITKDGPLVSKHGRFKTDDVKQLSCHIKHGMFCDYSVTTSGLVNTPKIESDSSEEEKYEVTKADVQTKKSILKSANEGFSSQVEKKECGPSQKRA